MILPYDLAFAGVKGKEASVPYAQAPLPPPRPIRKVTAMRIVPVLFALTLLSALPAAARPVVNIDEVRDMAFAKGNRSRSRRSSSTTACGRSRATTRAAPRSR